MYVAGVDWLSGLLLAFIRDTRTVTSLVYPDSKQEFLRLDDIAALTALGIKVSPVGNRTCLQVESRKWSEQQIKKCSVQDRRGTKYCLLDTAVEFATEI